MRPSAAKFGSLSSLLLALGVAGAFALISAPAGLDRVRINLDALCSAHAVVDWEPTASCTLAPARYLGTEFKQAALRLATGLALSPSYGALAGEVASLSLDPAAADPVMGSRLLLLRALQDNTPPDLATWRSTASSNILQGTAAYLRAQNMTPNAEAAEALAYALDAAWYDQWQRAINAERQGMKLLETGRLAEAQAAYTRAIESMAAAQNPLAAEYTAYAYFRLAEIAEKQRETRYALELYRHGIWSSPQHSDFSRPVKLILATGGSIEDAYDYLAGVRKGGPQDNPTLWSYSADILAGFGGRAWGLRVLAETPVPLLDSPLIRDIEAKLTSTDNG